jgi:hypothetical protein
MTPGWKILLLSAALFGIAFAAEQLLVPGIVPVAFADEPQPLWAVEVAFVLRAIELMAAGAAFIALVLMIGGWAKAMLGRGAPWGLGPD